MSHHLLYLRTYFTISHLHCHDCNSSEPEISPIIFVFQTRWKIPTYLCVHLLHVLTRVCCIYTHTNFHLYIRKILLIRRQRVCYSLLLFTNASFSWTEYRVYRLVRDVTFSHSKWTLRKMKIIITSHAEWNSAGETAHTSSRIIYSEKLFSMPVCTILYFVCRTTGVILYTRFSRIRSGTASNVTWSTELVESFRCSHRCVTFLS